MSDVCRPHLYCIQSHSMKRGQQSSSGIGMLYHLSLYCEDFCKNDY